ncbi:MAG: DNA adenine methylase [Chloroflexi bacterium]|uniref:DNA adenine methylase n=1 Tax=Candidatus Flexifilum breve TaxID=3140694 RepID=UPI0031365B32|nr:DNA adenine methylase [Chloroflexota bacterium]
MRAPIKYFGGKGNMLHKLLAFFPDPSSYDLFIDAYGGSGVVLLNKPRTQVEIYNDLDLNVYSLMATLADPVLFAAFRQRAELALYDEATSNVYRGAIRNPGQPIHERAFMFWYLTRTRQGMGSGGFSINTVVRRRMSKSTSDFLSSVEGLPELHARLSSVLVTQRDALELIAAYDMPRTLVYADPPYVQSTRGKTRYAVDADDAHHRQLVEVLNGLQHARVVLSGYDNPIYAALRGFAQQAFQVKTVTPTGAPKSKTECVWVNFAAGTQPMFAEAEVRA